MIEHGDRLVSAYDCDLAYDRFPDERDPNFKMHDEEALVGITVPSWMTEAQVGLVGLVRHSDQMA